MIYNTRPTSKTRLSGRIPFLGERLEVKIKRMAENKEPITEISEPVYGSRADGVQPSTNIRSDRWDAAIDAMDVISKSRVAKRDNKHETKGAIETADLGKQASDGMKAEGEM